MHSSMQVTGPARVRAVLESVAWVLGDEGTVCMHRRKCAYGRTVLESIRDGGTNELGQVQRGAFPAAGWGAVHAMGVENMVARFNQTGAGPDQSKAMRTTSAAFSVAALGDADKPHKVMIKCAPSAECRCLSDMSSSHCLADIDASSSWRGSDDSAMTRPRVSHHEPPPL